MKQSVWFGRHQTKTAVLLLLNQEQFFVTKGSNDLVTVLSRAVWKTPRYSAKCISECSDKILYEFYFWHSSSISVILLWSRKSDTSLCRKKKPLPFSLLCDFTKLVWDYGVMHIIASGYWQKMHVYADGFNFYNLVLYMDLLLYWIQLISHIS